jgi:tetratricopeptide (TPR) repeat protein
VESSSLVQQGIAAYKAGNKDEAVRLLSQALRENRQDVDAWLYLGAALDDPTRKRQAFQQVLQIDPANEKARNALARLDQMAEGSAAPAQAPSKPSAKASSSAATTSAAARDRMNRMAQEGFGIPVEIEGAPERINLPYILEHGRERINQAIQLYTNRDLEVVATAASGATMWDVVFIGGLGVVAMGLAELVGGLIGWPLSIFRGFSGIGGLFWPFVSAIAWMIGTGAGYAGGLYAAKMYLENQGNRVNLVQHGMYYGLIALPWMLVSAFTHLVSSTLGVFACFVVPILSLGGFALAIYSFILLKEGFDRIYGSAENRGLITAGVSVGGWIVGFVIAFLILGIFRTIFGAIFRTVF